MDTSITNSFTVKRLETLLGDFFQPVSKLIQIIFIIIIAYFLVRFGNKIIFGVIEKQKKIKIPINSRVNVKRLDTIATIMGSVWKYTVYFIAAITIFTRTLGLFDWQAVIIPAGIGGIVVGFAAQSLIKDILAGMFILMENQFSVGDMVTIDGMTGTVEEIELRITRIRSFNGDVYIIPNGEITKVTNHTRNNKLAIVEVPVSYKADPNLAIETARKALKGVSSEVITEAPVVQGFTEMKRDYAVLRIIAKTLPNRHWEIEREIRLKILESFRTNKIEFPEYRPERMADE